MPVEDIEFPAIAICNSGSLEENIIDAIGLQIGIYLERSTNGTYNRQIFKEILELSHDNGSFPKVTYTRL